jgi:hypothetical protein
LETVNCCAFLKRRLTGACRQLTQNLEPKNLSFFLSLQCFTPKVEQLNDSYSRNKHLRAPFAENKDVHLCPDQTQANVIRVKRREIQTLHCSKRFNFSNAYSAQGFI